MAKKADKGPIKIMITTGDGALRVRTSRLIPPGRRFASFADQLEDAIQRSFKAATWKRDGRTWIIDGPMGLSAFQRFMSLVDVITTQAGMELAPVQMDDISDKVVLLAPELGRARRAKPIEDTIAQIKGELRDGRISVAKAVSKLGAAYDRRYVELPNVLFERVLDAFLKASPPTGSSR